MFIWLMLVLKIPIAALLWLVWWASKSPELPEPEPARVESEPQDSPHGPRPRRPRPPRRGPHAEPAPLAPSRVRAMARAQRGRQPLR